jgi:hypothetical protein
VANRLDPPPFQADAVGENKQFSSPWIKSLNQLYAYVRSLSGGGGGGVTAVTASAPLASSGGATPNISLPGGVVSSVNVSLPLTSTGGANPSLAINVFGASGASHAAGIVPDPGATPGTSKFLREDGTFATAGAVSPLTTKGDIYGFDTVNNRIPVGTDGQVLTADSTQTLGVKYATLPTPVSQPHAFSVYTTSNKTVTVNTFTAVTYDVKLFDTSNEFTLATGKFQPTVAGYYILGGQLESNLATGGAAIFAAIYKNGTLSSPTTQISGGYYYFRAAITSLVFLNGTTDFVQFMAFSPQPTLNGPNPGDNYFWGALVSPTATGVPTASSLGGGSGADQAVTSLTFVDITKVAPFNIAASVGDILEIEINYGGYATTGVQQVTGQFVVGGTADPDQQLFQPPSIFPTILTQMHRIRHTVVAGDISAGLVSVKYQMKVTANTWNFGDNANFKALMTAKNFGDGSGVPANSGGGSASLGLILSVPTLPVNY